MKTRPIDIVLLIALVAVSGAIVWTLFSLGGGSAPAQDASSSPPPDAPPSVTLPGERPEDASNGGEVVPIAPGDDASPGQQPSDDANDDPAAADGEDGEDGGGAAANGEEAGDEAGPDDGEEAEPEPAAPLEPVPEGSVELGRVGFSYVTGGAGACGVVLEPWQHVAVSRELLDAYGCGAEVTVQLDDETGGRSEFRAVVADTMNPSFSRTVNVYVGEDEPAMQYGLTSGSIEPLD